MISFDFLQGKPIKIVKHFMSYQQSECVLSDVAENVVLIDLRFKIILP
jgi:hypothetical protein